MMVSERRLAISDVLLTFRRSITAHDVEEVQAIEDRYALERAADDLDVRVVGHDVGHGA